MSATHPKQPWGSHEREQWRDSRPIMRRYSEDVIPRIKALRERFHVHAYGVLNEAHGGYTLFAIQSPHWSDDKPVVLVTGGVHGYETSGVKGALEFVEQHGGDYPNVNLLVAPCVSPWAYERIQRWNADAIDPNRSFVEASPVPECQALMELVAPIADRVLLHIDLHETTDTDESEFRPMLAARDGVEYEPGEIPDGFYLCGDEDRPELDFQTAIIEAVSRVTHIAPPDANGQIIETDVVAPGVILYPANIGLSPGITNARFRTLTEVYPDSPRTSPEECNAAQVAAVRAAIAYALTHSAQ
jgi:hypothetical protein